MPTKTTDQRIDELVAEIRALRAEVAQLKAVRPSTWTDPKPRIFTNAISDDPYYCGPRRGVFGR